MSVHPQGFASAVLDVVDGGIVDADGVFTQLGKMVDILDVDVNATDVEASITVGLRQIDPSRQTNMQM
jgi:hypothetical protein